MKQSPILFSTDMVKAILDGRKTMTRRTNGLEIINKNPEWYWLSAENYIDKKNRFCQKIFSAKGNQIAVCPYGAVGGILWVRETFGYSQNGKIHFKASVCSPEFDKPADGWKPSIHIPKDISRIWLQITDIRIERLHDVTDNDAISEGVTGSSSPENIYINYLKRCWERFSARQSFLTLWACVNGIKSVYPNPWVWVISFKVLSTTGKPAGL